MKSKILKFIDDSKEYPIIAGFASGLYPLAHYYNSNFTLLNSIEQFVFFTLLFVLAPCILFYVVYHIVKKWNVIINYQKYLIPVLNFCWFTTLIIITTYGFKKKILAGALVLAFVLAILLYKHIKKLIVFQLLMTVAVFIWLIPNLKDFVTYDATWQEQPDDIEKVIFKKRPNIYVIQPDGYPNLSELSKGYYNYDNSEFETYLRKNQFKIYPNYRSNYPTTLSSNTALFSMKHHYYYYPTTHSKELFGSREIITGNNPVISIFKNNDYKTSLLLESSYLLVNRPELAYDHCNIDYSEVSYFARGFEFRKDVTSDLEKALKNNESESQFYFIEKISPGHISTYERNSLGKNAEREKYLSKIEQANNWLKETIELITSYDKNSLIIIVADHGGFVGFDYTRASRIKQTDRDLIYSVFSSALMIKWPENAPVFDNKIKTSVNLFRVLFAYLGDDSSYLKNLQDDKSFLTIEKGADFGVYEQIDEKGNVVFNKLVYE